MTIYPVHIIGWSIWISGYTRSRPGMNIPIPISTREVYDN